MAVFRNSKSKPDSAPAIHSLLGKDVMLTGEIHTGSQSLRIEGSVEGIIHSTGEISIAPGGLVKGTIYAKHLVVTGRAAAARVVPLPFYRRGAWAGGGRIHTAAGQGESEHGVSRRSEI